LSKFAKLMRVILDNSKKKFMSIEGELYAISFYLNFEKPRLKNNFDYKISIHADIDKEFDEMSSILVQPYPENAVLHGIAPKKTLRRIDINLYLEQNHLVVCGK
jgi:LytS/YehU family sensor histidine kinase